MGTNTQDIHRENIKPRKYREEYRGYTIRLESDKWSSFNPENDAIYAEISTPNGNKYHINLITPIFIIEVFDKNKETGECLGGTYFCMPQNMVIVRDLTRDTVCRAIDDLIDNLELHHYLERVN